MNVKMKKSASHGSGEKATLVSGAHLYANSTHLQVALDDETNKCKCTLPTNYSQPTLSYRMMNWSSVVSVEWFGPGSGLNTA